MEDTGGAGLRRKNFGAQLFLSSRALGGVQGVRDEEGLAL